MSRRKLFAVRVAVLLSALAIIAVASAAAYMQLSKPQSNETRIETDVKTKDIIIKSEKDLSTASNELDSFRIDDSDSKTLDDLSNGF